MIRYFGFVLVTAGSAAIGILMASGVKQREQLYRQALFMLSYMQGEIEFHLSTLDKISLDLSQRLPAPLGGVFSAMNRRILQSPGNSLGQQMRLALRDCGQAMPAELQDELSALFSHLGRQDVSAQIRAIEESRQRLSLLRQQLFADRRERCRAYRTIGLCAGFALAILLI